jgi:hypothetical protein
MRLRKDVDSADMAFNLRNAIWALPYLTVMGLIWGYLAGASSGAWVGLVAAILVSATIGFATSILGVAPVERAVNSLYRPGRKTIGNRKRPAGDLNVVRYHKLCNRFDQALLALEAVLAKEPDFPEALFLRAQVLWEGFDDREGAKSSLMRIMKMEPDEKAVFRCWALNFYRELSEESSPYKGEEMIWKPAD